MPKRKKSEDDVLKSLQDIHVTLLLALGVRQQEVQKLVGVDIVRVSRIAKALKKKKK